MSWETQIDNLVRAALPHAETLPSLLQQLPNIYPTDVLASLERLRQEGNSAVLATGGQSHAAEPRLPTPHPLDYEWRYTDATRAALTSRINGIAPRGVIAFFGAPSMYVAHRGDQETHLIDANSALRSFLPGEARWHRTDLLVDSPPALSAELVLADPPWYPEHLAAFVVAAAHVLKMDGVLLLSLPGKGTRPTIAEELTELYATARLAGFDHTQTEDGALRYDVPPFERNALRAAGVSLSAPWRAGDLALFRKTRVCDLTLAPVSTGEWREYRFADVRIRVAETADEDGDARLIQIVEGDVLPTVSRRDPRRQSAKVWTSGNRIFSTRSVTALHRIISALELGDPISAEDPATAETVKQIRTLIDEEQRENVRTLA